ncbi:hypothetical protein C823_004114 [Eubacterium plexicaudatum ASF492]|uniref:Uncharacterized protein n=1 Tax=Eubacterium plexicaudatum ASF492 TaxID=1235802 RepID=N1ZLH1_9FIRM|nr:hypothetical protein C823_004114 [Eubacterium plexicaudatum ASF492]
MLNSFFQGIFDTDMTTVISGQQRICQPQWEHRIPCHLKICRN